VKILATEGIADSQLPEADIYVGDSSLLCGRLPSEIAAGSTYQVTCSAPILGNNIRVHKAFSSTYCYYNPHTDECRLHFAEIEVTGRSII